MSRPVTFRSAAKQDVEGIYEELEAVRAGLGGHFKVRLREVLDRMTQFPEIYPLIWRDVRAARLRRFRYVLYHVAHLDHVEVIGVVHCSRHESVWKDRLE